MMKMLCNVMSLLQIDYMICFFISLLEFEIGDVLNLLIIVLSVHYYI